MRTAFLLLCLLAVLAFSAGCARRLSLTIPATTPIIVAHGATTEELGWSDPRAGKLRHWLAANQSGWSPYYVTTPSGGVIVHAGTLQLQFVGDSVIVTSPAGLFSKTVRPSEYDFLRPSPTHGNSP